MIRVLDAENDDETEADMQIEHEVKIEGVDHLVPFTADQIVLVLTPGMKLMHVDINRSSFKKVVLVNVKGKALSILFANSKAVTTKNAEEIGVTLFPVILIFIFFHYMAVC